MPHEVYLPHNYSTFIGMDVDKNKYVITKSSGNMSSRPKTMPANPENFFNYISKNHKEEKVICAYEAGPTGFGLYDYLAGKNMPCLVVSPLSIPQAKSEKVKTNVLDSRKIAEYLQAGKLRSIRVPVEEYRQLRHLVRVRELYAMERIRVKQRIKALLLLESLYSFIGDDINPWNKRYIKKLRLIETTPAVRYRLDMLLEDMEYVRRQTLSINRRLRVFCVEHPEIAQYMGYLISIPGIGFVTGITILAVIGDPKELRNVRELGSFLGVVPTERSTGDIVNRGSITHLGNRNLRGLLIEAAWSAIRTDTGLNQFYHRIRNRHHPKCASKKAIVAVARKLTQIIYCVLTENRKYVRH